MSTYTDLHMRRRENLTILRHPGAPEDGITPQRVIFANPENIYEGTFKGRIDATSVDLSAATLTNVKINGAVIQDAMISSEGRAVSIVELTSNLSELSGKVDGLFSTIEDLSSTVDSKLEKLSVDIGEETDSKLSNLSLYFIEKLKLTADILSTSIKDEVSARIDQYSTLSDQISSIENVTSNLKDQIVSAQLSIDAISKQIDNGLSGAMHYYGALLSGYDKTTIKDFLLANFNDYAYKFSKGDQFKILSSIDKLYANDYILFNQNIMLSAVSYDNIDIIRDVQAEGEHLKSLIDTVSANLSVLSVETEASLSQVDDKITELNKNLGIVSSSVELSIYNINDNLNTARVDLNALSNETIESINQIDNSITKLNKNLSAVSSNAELSISTINDNLNTVSADLSALSNETTASLSQIDSNIIELSGNLSAVSSNIELSISTINDNLNTVIDNVDNIENNISTLSSNLSSYSSTLRGIDRSYDEMNDISSDNLILTDVNLPGGQHKHNQYYMTFLSGTIVIKPLP